MNARTQSPTLVTGGTGTLGSEVIPRLRAAGRSVRVLSRQRHGSTAGIEYVTGDLNTGEGVDAAVDGVEAVINCAGTQKGDDIKARTLVRAASRGGKPHVVHISVVGAGHIPVVSRVDRLMFAYFASKEAAERVIAESDLPWTTLRATQFYDLLLTMGRGMAKLPVVPVAAGWRFQPIDTGEVADRLVELVLGDPAGLVPDLAGPHIYTMADLFRAYLRAAGKRRPMLPIRLPGGASRAVRAGANLAPDRAVGRRTWEDFLAERIGGGGAATRRSRPERLANSTGE